MVVSLSAMAQEKGADRPVAKVGNETIMLSEVNALASRALSGVTDPEEIARIRAGALSGLIFEKSMLQRIEREKFLENPEVAQAHERVKREALFNLYFSQKAGAVTLPNEQTIDRYIKQNPDLFEDRQTFRISEIRLATRDTAKQKAYLELAEKQGLDALTDQLKRDRVPYARANVWRGGEQLDREYRSFVMAMRDGQIKSRPSDGRQPFTIIQRIAAYADPVRPEDARQAIASGLVAEARDRKAAELRASIRADAGVKIFDDALKVEVAALEPAEPKPVGDSWGINRPGNRQMVNLIWTFLALPLVLLVIWNLVRKGLRTPKPRLTRPERFYEQMARAPFLKIVAILTLFALVYVPAIALFVESPAWLDQRTLLVSIPAALFAFLALVLMALKVADLRKILVDRPWVSVLGVLGAQAVALVVL
jgi:EpsD family peptidyl-prolyl cis-trans isomerase